MLNALSKNQVNKLFFMSEILVNLKIMFFKWKKEICPKISSIIVIFYGYMLNYCRTPIP